MASKKKIRPRLSAPSLSLGDTSTTILHEGWCVKESGSAFMGKTNWRKRWFKLVQKKQQVLLQYYRSRSDKQPAGSVALDVTYTTRQLESHEKSQPNCFAVGPLIDDGAIRTYYISCPTVLAMQEWMTVIDAAIQGVPELAQRRRQTIKRQYDRRNTKQTHRRVLSSTSSVDSLGDGLHSEAGLDLSVNMSMDMVDGGAVASSVDSSIQHEDLSDDEVWESLEDEVSGDEDDEDTVHVKRGFRKRAATIDSGLSPSSRLMLYDDHTWRMDRWRELCEASQTLSWSKIDTKDGVTVARCKFGRSSNGHAIVKLEGNLFADPATVFQFLQISTREGGKLDYIFRNENILQEFYDEPKGTIISNHFLLPIPRISTREIVAMKLWIPQYLTRDGTSGLVMYSVEHPEAPEPDAETTRINVNTSGLILRAQPGQDGEVHSHMVILLRVAFYGALHRMFKGAYNSGLLKLGFRTTFTHIAEQLQKFVDITNV